jgi:RNA polymerase sigma factor (sigma-70 family)
VATLGLVSVAEPAVSGLETAAAERLYERNSSRVYAYCLQMLRSREDAEDASQTTFMQAFRALQRGVVPVFETAWLLTIARNVCLARHRAGRRRRAVELARDPHDLQELAAGREQDGSLVGLQEALARLPEMQRRAFLLREWQERSYAEIAGELGVTVPAVEALLFRARRTLARDLGDGRRRRLALDITSLVAAAKSALGGAAAVKVAVGAAVVVGAGAAAGGVAQKLDSRAPMQTRAPAVVERNSRVSPSGRMNAAMKASAPAATTSVAGQSGRARAADDPVTERPVAPTTPSAPEIPSEPSVPTAPPVPTAPEVPPASEAGATEPLVPPPPAVPEAPAVPPPPAIPAAPAVPPPPVEVPKAPTEVLPVEPPPLPEAPELPDAPSVPGLPLGP